MIDGVPATQHDLWIWVHGTGDDVIFDVGRAVAALVDTGRGSRDEVGGWVYRDSRDLTGFIDGTENPAVEEAFEVATTARAATPVPAAASRSFSGGSTTSRRSTRSRSRSRKA